LQEILYLKEGSKYIFHIQHELNYIVDANLKKKKEDMYSLLEKY